MAQYAIAKNGPPIKTVKNQTHLPTSMGRRPLGKLPASLPTANANATLINSQAMPLSKAIAIASSIGRVIGKVGLSLI